MSYKIDIRKSIYNLVGRVHKREIVNIFRDQNIGLSTIYRIIKECEEGIPCINLPKNGRPQVLAPNEVNRLIQAAHDRVGTSTRKLGRRFGVAHMTVGRILAKNGLKYRKRRKCPKYTVGQLERIPRCCRILRRQHFIGNRIIVMDDEKYFTLSNSEIKGNDGFYTSNIENCPDNVKFKPKMKFEDKVLVWCAISQAGISRPYVGRVRGEAVDANVYIRKCLPKLIHFINTYHQNDEIIFWPDLASCHYARITQNWLTEHNVNYVPRNDNPPNVPQARPIEEFWALLSRKVYDKGWEAQNEAQLRTRIFQKIREVDIIVVQRMMGTIRAKLRAIEDHGPLSVL